MLVYQRLSMVGFRRTRGLGSGASGLRRKAPQQRLHSGAAAAPRQVMRRVAVLVHGADVRAWNWSTFTNIWFTY